MNIQLHGSSDASEKAYGTVGYLRDQLDSIKFVTTLILSKTQVAPVDGETVPRSEILEVMILGRLIDSQGV